MRQPSDDTLAVRDAWFESAVRAEVKRARDKFPCEESLLSDAEWIAVLIEEIGECAETIQRGDYSDLRQELIQVGAVAARWSSSLDDDKPVTQRWSALARGMPRG